MGESNIVLWMCIFQLWIKLEDAACPTDDLPVLSMCQNGEVSGQGVYLDTSRFSGLSVTCTCSLRSHGTGTNVIFNPVVIDKNNCQSTVLLDEFAFVQDCTSQGSRAGHVPVTASVDLTVQGQGRVESCIKLHTMDSGKTLNFTCYGPTPVTTTVSTSTSLTTIATFPTGSVPITTVDARSRACQSSGVPVVNMCASQTREGQKVYVDTSLFSDQYKSCSCSVQVIGQSGGDVEVYSSVTDFTNCQTKVYFDQLNFYIGCARDVFAKTTLNKSDKLNFYIRGIGSVKNCLLIQESSLGKTLRVQCSHGQLWSTTTMESTSIGFTTEGTSTAFTTEGTSTAFTTDGTSTGFTTDGTSTGFTTEGTSTAFTTEGTSTGFTSEVTSKKFTTEVTTSEFTTEDTFTKFTTETTFTDTSTTSTPAPPATTDVSTSVKVDPSSTVDSATSLSVTSEETATTSTKDTSMSTINLTWRVSTSEQPTSQDMFSTSTPTLLTESRSTYSSPETSSEGSTSTSSTTTTGGDGSKTARKPFPVTEVVVGISVAFVLVLFLIAIFLCYRHKQRESLEEQRQSLYSQSKEGSMHDMVEVETVSLEQSGLFHEDSYSTFPRLNAKTVVDDKFVSYPEKKMLYSTANNEKPGSGVDNQVFSTPIL